MRLAKLIFGLAAAGMLLSGCGGGSGSSAAATSDASATAPSSTASDTAASSSTGSTSGSTSGSGSGSGTGTSAPTGSATVSWTAPTDNTNGTALTDLAGFHIHYGTSSGSLTQEADVSSPSAVSDTINGLAAGTWYFAVSAYTTDGVESGLSAVGSKTIT
jgi:hypothetical protein